MENFALEDTPQGSLAEAAPAPGSGDLLRRQEAVVAIGRRAIAQPEISMLMQDAAQLMAEMLEADFGAVIECSADPNSITLQLLSRGTGLPMAQSHRLPAAGKESLAGYTLQERRPVLVDDFAAERRFQDPLMRRLRVRAGLSVPLVVQEKVFGALAALATGTRSFGPEDVFFAETIAHLVATTADRKKVEEQLAEERLLARTTLDTVDALVLRLDPQGRVRSINRAGQRITGFGTDELRERTIWSVFSLPGEAKSLETALGRLAQGEAAVEHQSVLLTKHSQKHRVAWNYGAVRDEGGRLRAIIATGVVIPEPDHEVGPDGRSLPSAGRDRRTQPRKPYPYEQMLAPLVDGKLPPRDQFKPVSCHDISPGGFSFVAGSPPASDSFVVALGRGPALTYLIAQVAHMTRLEQNGERVYLIGCSYMGRADY